ncbi:MAG: glycosyltransferase [Planctomycetes bacterium]|nr:glycosyltransferase [Planctomycetota bacterium]
MRACGIKSAFFALNTDIGKLNIGFDYALPFHISSRRRHYLELWYLWTVFARYDVIHFHFLSFLSFTGWELEYLRRLNKVIVFHFRGCDLRQRSINLEKNPELNCCQECDYPAGSCETETLRQRWALAEKYGDLFYVTTPDLLDFMPQAEHLPFIAPQIIDFNAIESTERDPDVFRVVTSSNHPGIDGVSSIREAIARLQEEGERIELVEIRNTPYMETLSIYKSADVFAGKLRMGYYNNANIEAMMLGVANISYIRDEYLASIPDCPVIVARPDSIYDKLKYFAHHREELAEIGRRGPEFVRAHHDPRMICERLLKDYDRVMQNRIEGA